MRGARGRLQGHAQHRAAQTKIKDLALPDPRKVKLNTECAFEVDPKTGKTKDVKDAPINPFKHTMVVANPTVSAKVDTGPTPADIALLKSLNKDETFSLLKCPKQFTLLVKAYQLSAQIQTNKGVSGMFSLPSSTRRATRTLLPSAPTTLRS